MCAAKDETEFSERLNVMDRETRCGKPSKTLLFVFNCFIWAGSCALLALGIFALVDTPYKTSITDGNMLIMGASVLIIVGGVGFLISFIGCCGAMTSNRCLIMTYVVVLILMLAAMLIGGILGFLFTSRLQDAAVETMKSTLENYSTRNDEAPSVKAWNTMQRTLKCCGVLSFRDWETYNVNFKNSQKIPVSCCTLDSDGKPKSGCTTATRASEFFSQSSDGCHRKLIQLIEQNTPIVAAVSAIVAFFMILGVILGIVVYNRI